MEQNIENVDNFDDFLMSSYDTDIELDEDIRQETGEYYLSYFVTNSNNQYNRIGTLN